jgi:TonB-linked SusC/RagA family outer membrane protein
MIRKCKTTPNVLLPILFLFSSFISVSAQQLQGVVRDKETKESIVGASIVVKGTSTGTTSDVDGHFSLTLKEEKSELLVSYVGYKTETIALQGETSVQIFLKEDITNLDQVVVIGYGVQKKSDLTGAISSIKAEEITSLPTTNVLHALQGKAAGVEIVQNSGAPGASSSIRIRGMGTINDSDPLYVVDGILMDGIDYLSADDIESIEILKDASSAAIYGSRAANGVVLITTKSGKFSTEKLNINFNSYLGWQESWKDPGTMSKEEFIYFGDYVTNVPVNTQYNPDTQKLEVKPETQEMLDNGNNWWNDLSRKAVMQKYNLSIYGGNENLNYYMSGNYLFADGIIKESHYDRKSFNAKMQAKLLSNLMLSSNITYASEDRRVVSEGTWGVIKTAINYNPLIPLYDQNGSYNWTTPVENLRRTTYDTYRNNFIGQLELKWNILKNLNFMSRANLAVYEDDTRHFTRYNVNPEIIGDIKYDVQRQPASMQNISWDNTLTYAGLLNEDHSLTVMAGQTMERSTQTKTWAFGTGRGGYNPEYDALQFAQFSQKVSGNMTAWSAWGLLGRLIYSYKDKYLFQANFRADASSRFAKKNRWGYFPSASIGWKINAEPFMSSLDGINLLKIRVGWGELGNNRIGNFAYESYVGNQVSYIYGIGTPAIKSAMNITQYGNPDIRWERTQTFGPGVDLNLWNNRFTSSFDFFIKDTHDMLIRVPIVYSSGIGSVPMQNAGSVRNTGYEIQLNYRNQMGNFRYEIGGNFTQVKNEVTSLGQIGEPIYGGNLGAPNNLGYVNKTVVGAPIGCFYGWKTAGIMTENDFNENGSPKVPVYASGSTYKPGDMKFVDINNDGKIDDNDRTFIGTPHPDFFYGFNVNLAYKGFELSTFFQGVYGNQIFDVTKYFRYSTVQYDGNWNVTSYNNYSNVAEDYFDKVWRPAPDSAYPQYRDHWGENLTGTVPLPASDGSKNKMNFRNSDFYISDGSYLRLKNIQLTYAFPDKFCKSRQIKNLKLYVSATNLLTVTEYDGLDPEIGKTVGQESNNLYIGIDQGIYPQARTYMFGLTFDF